MIYLASPYSHPDPAVREARFQAVCRQAAAMIQNGIAVFSPIAHSHGMAAYGLPVDWEFWRRFDLPFIKICSAVWVLKLDGWKESRGVAAEIALARQRGKPLAFLEPESMNDQTPATGSRAGAGWVGGPTDAMP